MAKLFRRSFIRIFLSGSRNRHFYFLFFLLLWGEIKDFYMLPNTTDFTREVGDEVEQQRCSWLKGARSKGRGEHISHTHHTKYGKYLESCRKEREEATSGSESDESFREWACKNDENMKSCLFETFSRECVKSLKAPLLATTNFWFSNKQLRPVRLCINPSWQF